MAATTDYLRILEDLGVDTGHMRTSAAHASRILKEKDGEGFTGLYINRQAGITYFTVNPEVATVEVDWNLWQTVPSAIAVPYFDRDKQNIVPKPGQEREALRSLLGLPPEGGFLHFLRNLFGRSS